MSPDGVISVVNPTTFAVGVTASYKITWTAFLSGSCTLGVVINTSLKPSLIAGAPGGQVQATSILDLTAGDTAFLEAIGGICDMQPGGIGGSGTSASMTIVRLN